MQKRKLRLLAGPKAYRHIQEKGLSQSDITAMLGASGGPKWFILSKLDQYLCSEFFRQRNEPVYLLGSSAGAWRFACYAQTNPAEAIARFAHLYSHTVYKSFTRDEVTATTLPLVDAIIPEQGLQEILSNPVFKLNFSVARPRHVLKSSLAPAQYAGMASAAMANILSRDLLQLYYQRLLFHSGGSDNPFYSLPGFQTRNIQLTESNLKDALLASGSIPMVLHSVKKIDGAGRGPFQDGGIIDYHFNLNVETSGLVLYPHFYPEAVGGWFDKPMKSRRASAATFSNVVMLCPSQALIESLPHKRISDRKDFQQMETAERIDYWQTVIATGQYMADEFHELVEKGNWNEVVEPLL